MFQNLALSIAPDGSAEVPMPAWEHHGAGHWNIEALSVVRGWSPKPISYSPTGVFLNAFAVILSLTPTRRRTSVNGVVVFEGWTPPGAMRIQKPGEHVATEMFTGFDQVALYIPTTTFQSILREQNACIDAEIDIVDPLWGVDRFIDASLRCMAAALNRKSLESYHYLSMVGRAIASHILYNYSADSEPGVRDDLDSRAVERAIQFIDANMEDSLSLAEMALAAGLPIDKFRREFKASTQMSPHQYLIRRRVDRACERIAAGDRPKLADIALECGFADQSHLTTTFRRVLGVSPARFMRRV